MKKTIKTTLIIVASAFVLAPAASAWAIDAVYANAAAGAGELGNPPWESEVIASDTGTQNASASAGAHWPLSNPQADASANAWADLTQSHIDGSKTFQSGYSAYFSASAGYNFGAIVNGPGGPVSTTIDMTTDTVQIVSPYGSGDDSTTIGFHWSVDGDYDPSLQGTFELFNDGDYSGTGIYGPGKFAVNDTGSAYEATYIGGNLITDLPVGSSFDFDWGINANSTASLVGNFTIQIILPEGYEADTPEPTMISLLLVGGIMCLVGGFRARPRK